VENYRKRLLLPLFAFLVLILGNVAMAQQPPGEEPPANVAGKWTIYSKGEDGKTATQSIEVSQDGGTITGHFKGPNQSGGLEGTMNGRHILFRTKTPEVLTFRGTVDGNSIEGTFDIRGKKGTWEARRPD
jgi:hypothetical protein